MESTGKKGGAADQSTHERTGLERVCKGETPRMKNIAIEISEGEKIMSLG
jgi:hypothetical protein